MAGTTPYFELHIRPMFRLVDCDHMSWFGNLADYDFVKANAPDILTHLTTSMPTPVSGGLWPDGWVSVFRDWIAAGFPRLALTAGTYAARKLSSQGVQLRAVVTIANANDAAWLERLPTGAEVREYILYYRAGSGGGGGPITIEEDFDPQAPKAIFITDRNGRQQVPITG